MIGSVELLRIAACVAIVAFHLQLPGRSLTLGGLHAFVALTVAFSVRSARRQESYQKFARGRALALGVPWLFWCAFYALDGLRAHVSPLDWLRPWTLLVGPRIHLWFLPFALLSALLVASLARKTSFRSWLIPTSMLIAGAASCWELEAPFAQWISVLPSAALGLCLSEMDFGDRRLILLGLIWCVACCTAIAFGLLSFLPILVGGAATLVAWVEPAYASPRTVLWARLSLGVYLLHPFFASVTYGLLASSAWLHFAATLALSFVSAWALKQIPFFRRFV